MKVENAQNNTYIGTTDSTNTEGKLQINNTNLQKKHVKQGDHPEQVSTFEI